MVSCSSNSAQDQALEDDLFGFELVGEKVPATNEVAPPETTDSAASEGDESLRNFTGPIRFYAVWKVGLKPTRVEVVCHKWTFLCELLQGKRLTGSGVQLKAFDDARNAVLYIQGWCSIRKGEDVKIFTSLDRGDEYRRYCM